MQALLLRDTGERGEGCHTHSGWGEHGLPAEGVVDEKRAVGVEALYSVLRGVSTRRLGKLPGGFAGGFGGCG